MRSKALPYNSSVSENDTWLLRRHGTPSAHQY
jgi:hypothetical protein